MQNAKRIRNQDSHIPAKHILAILIGVTLCGIIAWAQKE